MDRKESPVPRVKICCIRSVEEGKLAISHGASALGLVSHMPSGPGVVDEETIAQIARSVPPPIATFLLTSLTDADAIIAQQRRCGTNTLQLVDEVEIGVYAKLRTALPGISIVQVVHVTGPEAEVQAKLVAPHVNALLLDSGDPRKKIKELGGTGRVHDWDTSSRIVENSPVPVFLAGGLRPDNVREAINKVRPFGVDLCSSVRTNDTLDVTKLQAFFESLKTK